MTAPTHTAYASLLRRYQALVVDGVIYFIVVLVGLFAPSLLDLGAGATRALWLALFVLAILYEPVLVAARGGTVGHFRYGIRVVRSSSGRKLGFLRALGRGFLKGLLGLLSLIFLLVTRRAQALHDLAFGSIVTLAQPAQASSLDVIIPYESQAAGMPSGIRRGFVILYYSIAALVVLFGATGFAVSTQCLDSSQCSVSEKLLLDAASILWIVVTGVVLVLGWRGRLFGCRRRRASTDVRAS